MVLLFLLTNCSLNGLPPSLCCVTGSVHLLCLLSGVLTRLGIWPLGSEYNYAERHTINAKWVLHCTVTIMHLDCTFMFGSAPGFDGVGADGGHVTCHVIGLPMPSMKCPGFCSSMGLDCCDWGFNSQLNWYNFTLYISHHPFFFFPSSLKLE